MYFVGAADDFVGEVIDIHLLLREVKGRFTGFQDLQDSQDIMKILQIL